MKIMLRCIYTIRLPLLLLSLLGWTAVSRTSDLETREWGKAGPDSNLVARWVRSESISRLAPRAASKTKRNISPFEQPKIPSEMLSPVTEKLKPALAKSKSTMQATDRKTIVRGCATLS